MVEKCTLCKCTATLLVWAVDYKGTIERNKSMNGKIIRVPTIVYIEWMYTVFDGDGNIDWDIMDS